ncbi:MAG: MATE family efflux transporter, partial [Myxococcota bacterium]
MSTEPEAWLRPVALLRLAVPAAAAALLHNLYRPVDQFFVSWLGSEAQAALGACVFVLIALYGCAVLVSAGVGPLVARAVGAADARNQAEHVATGLLGSAGVALAMAVAGWALVWPVVWGLGLTGETASHAALYLTVLLVTGAAIAVGPLVDACFVGLGNTTLPLVLQAIAVALNLGLTPLFIYGLDLGVAGAALGTTLSQGLATAAGLWFLRSAVGLRLEHLQRAWMELWPRARRVVRVGSPVAAGVILYAVVYWAMIATTLAPLGKDALAGLGIGFGGLEAFAWPLYLGCTVAVQSLVGRCLGAGRPDLAWLAIRRMLGPQLVLGFGVGAVFWFLGPTLVSGLAADEGALREGALYAIILAWSQPFVSLEALFEGVLAGSGDTTT